VQILRLSKTELLKKGLIPRQFENP